MNMIEFAEKGWVPDSLIRFGIRRLCAERLREEQMQLVESNGKSYEHRMELLKESPIAIETDAANAQHYEVPSAFYELVLGSHLKYSSCYWDTSTKTLDDAESAMLSLYCERAQIKDGQRILELGCGWGSLTLWLAKQYPNAHITGVSNSRSQRQHIEKLAKNRGLSNIEIITCDVNHLHLDQQFDRVVSIEMFEHVRNYQQLLKKISHWLTSDGKLFVHIFCHRQLLYPFETEGDSNWMGKYFFTGGLMPSASTLGFFQEDLTLENQWTLPGIHYQKTAQAWLDNTDQHKVAIRAIFADTYGEQNADRWVQRWRMFFMSCAELFGYHEGKEWQVCHYRFTKRQ